MCSYSAGTCLPPHQWPEKFDDMYDCFNAGYEQSMNKIEEVGREEVNKHGIFIRFACVKEEEQTESETWFCGKNVVEEVSYL